MRLTEFGNDLCDGGGIALTANEGSSFGKLKILHSGNVVKFGGLADQSVFKHMATGADFAQLVTQFGNILYRHTLEGDEVNVVRILQQRSDEAD